MGCSEELFNCDWQAVLNLLSESFVWQGHVTKGFTLEVQPDVASSFAQSLPEGLRSSGLVTFLCNVASMSIQMCSH